MRTITARNRKYKRVYLLMLCVGHGVCCLWIMRELLFATARTTALAITRAFEGRGISELRTLGSPTVPRSKVHDSEDHDDTVIPTLPKTRTTTKIATKFNHGMESPRSRDPLPRALSLALKNAAHDSLVTFVSTIFGHTCT